MPLKKAPAAPAEAQPTTERLYPRDGAGLIA